MNSIVTLIKNGHIGDIFIIKNVKFENGLLKCNLYSSKENRIINNENIEIRFFTMLPSKISSKYPVKNNKDLTFIINKIQPFGLILDIDIYKEVLKFDPTFINDFKINQHTDIKKLEEINNMELIYDINLGFDLSNIKCNSITLINQNKISYYDIKTKLPKYRNLTIDLYLDSHSNYKYIYEIANESKKLNLIIRNEFYSGNFSDENLIYLYKILNLKKDYAEKILSEPNLSLELNTRMHLIIKTHKKVFKEIETRNLTVYIFRQKSAR